MKLILIIIIIMMIIIIVLGSLIFFTKTEHDYYLQHKTIYNNNDFIHFIKLHFASSLNDLIRIVFVNIFVL